MQTFALSKTAHESTIDCLLLQTTSFEVVFELFPVCELAHWCLLHEHLTDDQLHLVFFFCCVYLHTLAIHVQVLYQQSDDLALEHLR